MTNSEFLNQLPIEKIKKGMEVSYSQTITDADVKAFAGISGDNNPVHMSEEYANKSPFKKRIAHGFLSVSFFSALFGTKLPGPGCVYVSQSLKFVKPVYLCETVTATVSVIEVNIDKRRVYFKTICTVNGKVVIKGEAELYMPLEE
jgi:3-hydroxybutyryl-CoA dehydratase